MFGISGGEALVLVAAALIILGPERLPDAVSWVMGTIRKVRDYGTGAGTQLREELGTDFEEWRKPLSELNELRQMTPRAIVTKHLFDGDASTIDDLNRSVSDVQSSVRDSLDVGRLESSGRVHPTAPEVQASDPAAPARRPDITDWDAT